MAQDTYIKRPSDTIVASFDFSDFVLLAVGDGDLAADITFLLHAGEGITVTPDMPTVGLINLTLTGGVMGRVYSFGIEASSPSGRSQVDMRVLRVRDPTLFALLPDSNAVLIGGSGNAFVTETADVLVTESGDILVWE